MEERYDLITSLAKWKSLSTVEYFNPVFAARSQPISSRSTAAIALRMSPGRHD